MAFVIRNITFNPRQDMHKLFCAVTKAIDKSRFTARVENHLNKLSIHNVRLRVSKHYCGNHPLPCPVRANPKPHIHSTCLEGADWVAWNDMLNDICDKMKITANIASSHVIVRKGDSRCIEYTPQGAPNGIDNEWQRDSRLFANRMGVRSPRSAYPNGTPGIPEYLPSKAARYQIVDHDAH